MKAYSLLYLSLCSLVILYACQSSHTTQMEKKELKMLEDSQPKSEEEAFENFYTPSHEALINWVLTDTATFSHPFTQSIKKEYVTIATSDDKCLRIYSWNTGEGGTMICWGNLIQYRSGTEIKAVHQSLDMLLHPDGEHDEIDFGSYIDTIYTYPCTDGSKTVHGRRLFQDIQQLLRQFPGGYADKRWKSRQCPLLRTPRQTLRHHRLEHSIADWYFLPIWAKDGTGFPIRQESTKPVCSHHRQHELHSDRYDIYHFNGTDLSIRKPELLSGCILSYTTTNDWNCFQNERLHYPHRQSGRRNHAIRFLEKHTADVRYSRTGAERQLCREGQHLPLLKRQLPLCGNHGRQSHPESTAQRKNHPATNARNERVLIRPLQTL